MQETYKGFVLAVEVKGNDGIWLGYYSVTRDGKILHRVRDIEIPDGKDHIGAQHKVMVLAKQYADKCLMS